MDKSRLHPTITAHIGTYVVNISPQIIYVPFLSAPPLKFVRQLTKCISDRCHIWAIWWPVDGMEEIRGRTIFDYSGDVWCLVQCKIVSNDYLLIITSAFNSFFSISVSIVPTKSPKVNWLQDSQETMIHFRGR